MVKSFALRLLPSIALAVLVASPAAHAQAPASPPPAPGTYAPPPAAAPPVAGRPADPGSQPRKLGLLVRMGLDFGGEKVADVTWSNGDTKTLKAGQLFTFSGGLFYHPAAPWALETTIGYKFDQANGSNGSIAFTRVPLDVVASFASGRHRIGVGPTVHFSPTFTCDAGICFTTKVETKFDTAIGGIAQYAYGFPVGRNSGFELAVRFTAIEYKRSGGSMDGNGGGILVGAWF